MLRMPRRWRRSKKLRRQPRPDRRSRRGRQADRNLVSRRGPDRTKEQDHPAMGAARDAPLGTARSADALGLHLRGHLPGPGDRRRPCSAALQYRRHGFASRRDLPNGDAGSPCCSAARSGRLAHFAKLDIHDNITLMPLPPKSPDLNPVENIWQFIRDNWLSNRVFRSYADILEHCCFAWNNLVDQPWTIMSIGLRDWAQRF